MKEKKSVNLTFYDGILRKPFLAEHWHKGFAAGLGFWLPFLWVILSTGLPLKAALSTATIMSAAVFLAIAAHHHGFALDYEKGRYRTYVWIAGLEIGTWNASPEIVHVTVRPYLRREYLVATQKPIDAVNTGFYATERGFQVLLGVKGKPIGITAAVTSSEKAVAIASRLGEILQVPVNMVS